MGKNKKKFIDKKKSATFRLRARDSSDPNYSHEPGGDRVFVRVDGNASSYSDNRFCDERGGELSNNYQDDEPNGIFAYAPEDYGDERTALPDHVRREILELGLLDDGYNYLLHLREIKSTRFGSVYYQNPEAELDLPPDLKAYDASRLEISKAEDGSHVKSIYSVAAGTVAVGVQKAINPEVASLLDDGDASWFGSDVEDFEEDFVIHANLPEESDDVEHDKKLLLVEESTVNKKEKESNTCSHGVYNFGSDEVRNGIHDIGARPRARRPLDEQFDLLELR